jgi:hypothetical protein
MKTKRAGRPKGSKKEQGFENPHFWLNVAKDPKISAQFREHGNARQKRNLEFAEKYLRGIK